MKLAITIGFRELLKDAVSGLPESPEKSKLLDMIDSADVEVLGEVPPRRDWQKIVAARTSLGWLRMMAKREALQTGYGWNERPYHDVVAVLPEEPGRDPNEALGEPDSGRPEFIESLKSGRETHGRE